MVRDMLQKGKAQGFNVLRTWAHTVDPQYTMQVLLSAAAAAACGRQSNLQSAPALPDVSAPPAAFHPAAFLSLTPVRLPHCLNSMPYCRPPRACTTRRR